MPFLHCISRFEVISYRNFYDTTTRSFCFLLFLLAFTSADIIFLQFFRTSFNINWKKDFCQIFPFFKGFTQLPFPPTPLTAKIHYV